MSTIHRTDAVPDDRAQILSIDAKQRIIISAPFARPAGDVNERVTRFCAEPPPDVFTAIATSLAADASAAISASTEQQAALKLGFALSENAATIERTQTINILREAMYRNCERYLSGAIDEDEFIVQSARDHRNMVHVLAVEQLTGVARAQATALTTIAAALASGTTEKAILALDDARSKSVKASETATKQTGDAAALPPIGPCSGFDATKPPVAPVTESQVAAKSVGCKAATIAATQAAEASAHYEAMSDALRKQTALTTAAEGKVSSAALTATAATAAIADRIVEIVKENNKFNEIEMTCVILFRNHGKQAVDHPLYPSCLELATRLASSRSAELLVDEEQAKDIAAYARQYRVEATSVSGQIWIALGNGQRLSPQIFEELAMSAGIQLNPKHAREIGSAQTLDQFVSSLTRHLSKTSRERILNHLRETRD